MFGLKESVYCNKGLISTELLSDGIILFSNNTFLVSFNILRFEISDNGRSEGSEDTPNETTVKFISEVSSKVCVRFVCSKAC